MLGRDGLGKIMLEKEKKEKCLRRGKKMDLGGVCVLGWRLTCHDFLQMKIRESKKESVCA